MKVLSVLTAALLAISTSALAGTKASVVLVHGAFADGSSWNKVITRLQKHHTEVIAVQLPLTSLKDDVAAFAPDSGQSTADLADSFPAPPGSASLAKTTEGYLYLPTKALSENFAPDVKDTERNVIAATQGPIKADAFGEKIAHAAWHDKPSWYVVSKNDRMINPELERAMAKKINANTTEVTASHVSMVSQPDVVTRTIEQALSGQQ
ncbi:TPA: alpha/beta hydrolase [Enterobacter hormaechei subsp. steigerwaltii]|nr:alpha/beta hydrolase [Enterobacter hormaechei subsp. steigerwaltii]HAV1785934.1 alpha/beta hydrolase [Enterobacter hormaechei subsp. steigerwaltii]HAV1797359.1 alpha/beta hydrolase [Enterobacter hormaechei subsp. steigerwaltii]HAV1799602.1 alpha/beta hydrolase [Enterobacter hormaechei subsp. steigerwaltii]